jgi:uncharacterized protein (DUF1697 family)
MGDLRALVSDLGYGDVRTHLQSGNVVCTGTGRPDVVGDAVSAAILDQLSLTVPVVARSAGEWATMVGHNPFIGDEDDPKRLHVTFLAGRPEPDRIAGIEAQAEEFAPDRFAVVGPDVYLHIPDSYADSRLQNGLLEKRLGQVCTTRNWRTIIALAELADRG